MPGGRSVATRRRASCSSTRSPIATASDCCRKISIRKPAPCGEIFRRLIRWPASSSPRCACREAGKTATGGELWQVPRMLTRHARPCCLARGHDRHLFGDITDTFWAGQVDTRDLVGAEEDAVCAVGCQGPNGNALATEGTRHNPGPPFEADVVF